MDGMTEMRSEHREIMSHITELSKSASKSPRQRKKLVQEASETLARHMDLEEQVIFPLAQEEASAKEAVLKGLEQHKLLKGLLNELETANGLKSQPAAWLWWDKDSGSLVTNPVGSANSASPSYAVDSCPSSSPGSRR